MDYKLYAVRVFTTDWDRSVAFYRDQVELGLKFADESMGWAEFDLGGPSLGIERVDGDDPETRNLVGRFIGISIAIPDMDQTYATLKERGVEFLSAPERQPWGGVLAHFKDPDDNVLTLLGSGDDTKSDDT